MILRSKFFSNVTPSFKIFYLKACATSNNEIGYACIHHSFPCLTVFDTSTIKLKTSHLSTKYQRKKEIKTFPFERSRNPLTKKMIYKTFSKLNIKLLTIKRICYGSKTFNNYSLFFFFFAVLKRPKLNFSNFWYYFHSHLFAILFFNVQSKKKK